MNSTRNSSWCSIFPKMLLGNAFAVNLDNIDIGTTNAIISRNIYLAIDAKDRGRGPYYNDLIRLYTRIYIIYRQSDRSPN